MDKLVTKLIFLSSLLLFISCNDRNNATTQSYSDSDIVSEDMNSVEDKIKNAKTIEDVRNNLNGTIWHYTENLDNSDIGCWIKVEFNNGRYTSYYALPSEGKWTQDKTGTYEIQEGRYSNTGERFIVVLWEGNIKNPHLGLTIPCEMALTTDDFKINIHSSHIDAVLYNGRGMKKQIIMKGQMEFGDYFWN